MVQVEVGVPIKGAVVAKLRGKQVEVGINEKYNRAGVLFGSNV